MARGKIDKLAEDAETLPSLARSARKAKNFAKRVGEAAGRGAEHRRRRDKTLARRSVGAHESGGDGEGRGEDHHWRGPRRRRRSVCNDMKKRWRSGDFSNASAISKRSVFRRGGATRAADAFATDFRAYKVKRDKSVAPDRGAQAAQAGQADRCWRLPTWKRGLWSANARRSRRRHRKAGRR